MENTSTGSSRTPSGWWLISIFEFAAITAVQSQVKPASLTHWFSDIKHGLGGNTSDLWIIVTLKLLLFCGMMRWMVTSENADRSRRRKVRVTGIIVSVFVQIYCVWKCLYRLVYGSGNPGEHPITSLWYWFAVAVIVICTNLEQSRLSKTTSIIRAAHEPAEEEPLLPIDPPRQTREEIAQNQNSWHNLLALLRMAVPDWNLLALAIAALSIAAISEAFIPHLTGQIVDLVAIQHNVDEFVHQTMILIIVCLTNAVFAGIRGSIFTYCTANMQVRLRERLFGTLLHQEIGFFDVSKSGDITSRLNTDTTKASDQIGLNMNITIRSILQAVGVLCFMLWTSWELTLVTCVIIPIVIVVSKLFGGYFRMISKQAQEQLGDANSVAQETLSAMLTVRAMAGEDSEMARYQAELVHYKHTNKKKAISYLFYCAIATMLPNMATVLVIFYGGKLVIRNEISGGNLVSFMLYQQSLSKAFTQISDIYTGVNEALGAADKVFEYINRPPTFTLKDRNRFTRPSKYGEAFDNDDKAENCGKQQLPTDKDGEISTDRRKNNAERKSYGSVATKDTATMYPTPSGRQDEEQGLLSSRNTQSTTLAQTTAQAEGQDSEDDDNTTLNGDIEFQQVYFRYPARPEVTVLHGLNLKISAGECVALVGPSGGGKSSIVNLIQQFYRPSSGRILIDGHPLPEYGHEFLHTHIGLVGQEPVLFARSIYENIAYGLKQKPTQEEVESAAKLANAHQFISELPDKYDTEAGEKGVQLSGGQKQRIAIARALVRHPAVLLLDEATSALDSDSEAVVQAALDNVMKERGCTIVVIAHRLSTVQNADRIVVIDKGHFVETGTHSSLLEANGMYAKLVARQLTAV